MGDGMDKVVDIIKAAAKSALPVLAELSSQIGFEFLLHKAIVALPSSHIHSTFVVNKSN